VEEQLRVDLLVVGGGMGGLSAAASAAESGAIVGVVEKGPAIGGSAAMSAGILWTAPDYEVLRREVPHGDPVLGRRIVDGFEDAAAWVRSSGVEMSPRSGGHGGVGEGFGFGYQVDIAGLFARWRRMVEQRGGWVVTRTAARRLVTDERGAVTGVVTDGPDGHIEVRAGAVVIATGGYANDPDLLKHYVGGMTERLLPRANPYSVGDGFRMARAAGAAVSRYGGGFYGHLVGSPARDWEERHYLSTTQYHSNRCVLIDLLGRRFCDEALGDALNTQAVLRQRDARAVLLCDERVRTRYVVTAPYEHGEVIDRFATSIENGARYATARTLDGLADELATWGIPPANVRRTLGAYHAAARGEAVELDAPVTAAEPLLDGPFHALEVQPAITFANAGLRVDADARVLDVDDRPIPNLFAAGVDVGGFYDVGYAGGLAASLVLGRQAAATAASTMPRVAAVGG
jgi:succinate dehydrogenase/fumarate reductase flavoprotein subunit